MARKTTIWQALKNAAGTPDASPRQMLTDLFGSGPRGGVNTTKAATSLGVSQSTVRRWAREGLPSNTGGQAMQRRHQRWLNESQAGRQAALGGPNSPILQAGSVKLTGKIKISAGDARSDRVRTTNFDLDANAMAMLAHVAATGSRGDLQIAFEHVASDRFGGADVSIDVHNLSFSPGKD